MKIVISQIPTWHLSNVWKHESPHDVLQQMGKLNTCLWSVNRVVFSQQVQKLS